jgi:hypothetical protein
LPHSLDELTPTFIKQVPNDPFDPAGGPLRYIRTGDSYVLYSVGWDGQDDGGRASERNAAFAPHNEDLRLDIYLAPWDFSTATNAPAAATAGDAEKEAQPVEDADEKIK